MNKSVPVIDQHKYITFKREEFLTWWQQGSVGGTIHDIPAPESLGDAVVIRRQDLFAVAGLDGYANAIRNAVDIAMQLDGGMDKDTLEYLTALANYFTDQAHEASLVEDRKVPD